MSVIMIVKWIILHGLWCSKEMCPPLKSCLFHNVSLQETKVFFGISVLMPGCEPVDRLAARHRFYLLSCLHCRQNERTHFCVIVKLRLWGNLKLLSCLWESCADKSTIWERRNRFPLLRGMKKIKTVYSIPRLIWISPRMQQLRKLIFFKGSLGPIVRHLKLLGYRLCSWVQRFDRIDFNSRCKQDNSISQEH